MTGLLLLGADDLRRSLPMTEAIAAMKEAFAAVSAGLVSMPPRGAIDAGGGTTLLMGAAVPGLGLAGKTVSVFPGNAARGRPVVSGLVSVLDPETGEPVAVCDGAFLTAWRTGAASGAATDLLARPEASTLALFGAGVQARTQLLAVAAVRPLRLVRVWAPDPDGLRRFTAETAAETGLEVVAAADPDEALAGADVVCTATTSPTPVFAGERLEPGCHLNAVGAFTPQTRELDATAVGRARVFVDQRRAALAEAGDLLLAEAESTTERGRWTELGEVVRNPGRGRRGPDEITLFKSVGLAVQDVAAAARAVARARRLGLGNLVELS
ncbi:MAG: ornithine cyclodeaminase family protein [Planctomycetota bacterium]|nr:MAG: ornithine cyclodeaminase family protein [Planctomycetota bacterium]